MKAQVKIIIVLLLIVFILIGVLNSHNFFIKDASVPVSEGFVDKVNFTLKWETEIGEPVHAFKIIDENIMLTLVGGDKIYDFNLNDAKVIRKTHLGGKIYGEILIMENSKNNLVIGSRDGDIFIFDIEKGEVVRTDNVMDIGKTMKDIKLNNEYLFYTGGGLNVYARRLDDFELIWHYDGYSTRRNTMLGLDDNKLYFMGQEGLMVLDTKTMQVFRDFTSEVSYPFGFYYENIYGTGDGLKLLCANKLTGDIRWKTELMIHDYCFDEDGVYCFDFMKNYVAKINIHTGKVEWTFDTGKNEVRNLGTTKKYLIFPNGKDNITLLDKFTGEKLWVFDGVKIRVGEKFEVHNDVLYIFTDEGKIHAYDLTIEE